jgi:hypothetical protein
VRALVLLAVLAPEASEPEVAIAWHREAKVSAQLQQRLRVALAGQAGVGVEAVHVDAMAIAGRRVARDVPRAAVEKARALGDRLDQIEAGFRAGELDAAAQNLGLVRAELEAAPGLPGVAELARREALISARVHWAHGDGAATDEALTRLITLDPTAEPSPRDVPPALATRFAELRDAAAAEQASWPTPTVEVAEGESGDGIELVVDGVPGRRAVPPGAHFLAAHRTGRERAAAFREVSTPWRLPPAPEVVVPASIPATREVAERVCTSVDVEWVVLAHQKDTRLGLEAYRCGSGFGPRWVGAEEALTEGVATIMGPAGGFEGERSRLDDAWPKIVAPRTTEPEDVPPPKKPWYKRAWVWVLVGGLVVGGVTTGAVLGTQGQGAAVGVDADDFL